MENGGWIKTHRRLKNWEWYKDSHMVHLFIHLLLSANHQEKKWKGVTVLPGQVITGRHSLSQDTGITERTVRTCIKRLISTGELTSKVTNKYTILTVVNWHSYQSVNNGSDQHIDQLTDQQVTSNRPASDHKQECKEGKEYKEEDVLPKGNKPAKHAYTCPHEEIISLYHELLPMCPRIREWTKARKALLRSRWNEKPERQDVGYWRKLFEYIALSDFLTGKTENPFIVDLEWIVRPKNFPKIVEGKYHRQNGQPILSASSRGIMGWAERERQRLGGISNEHE